MNDLINYLNPAVTLIVGLFAFIVYFKRRYDYKRDAANILLLEIKTAEKILKQVKSDVVDEKIPSTDIQIMPNESWVKYKHLFIRDLAKDEWEEIDDFYNRVKVIDEALSMQKSFFALNTENIRSNYARIVSDYYKEHFDEYKLDNLEGLNQKIIALQKLYDQRYGLLVYNPDKPLVDIDKHINQVNLNLSHTAIGQKLKKIARVKP